MNNTLPQDQAELVLNTIAEKKLQNFDDNQSSSSSLFGDVYNADGDVDQDDDEHWYDNIYAGGSTLFAFLQKHVFPVDRPLYPEESVAGAV